MSALRMTVRDRLDLAGGSVNEDRTGVAHFADAASAWVIDGASGLAEREYIPNGSTDAAWLAEQLSRYLASRDPSRRTVRLYFAEILTAIAAEYAAQVPDIVSLPPYALPSAAAIWAMLAEDHLTIAWQGDCCAVIAQGHDVMILNAGDESPWEDGINEVVRDHMTKAPRLVGSLMDALAGPLRQRRGRLNQPGGYWMLGIDPRAAAHIAQHIVALSGGATVLLASDGLWRLVDHFHAYDAAGLVAAASAKGLAALGVELRALEDSDRECRRVPRVKPFDDASGLLLDIASEQSWSYDRR
jgi:hypothetical protein